jgi:hydroxylamine reductase (hybrid-cluster protein)
MSRKDFISLMEAYEEVVLDKEFAPEGENDFSDRPNPEAGLEVREIDNDLSDDEHYDHELSHEDLEDNEHEKRKMVEAHLHTIRSHAHEIHDCIQNGANIEPWMEEKIALANDYVVHVANSILYRK